jgi:hypothetical protein
MAPKRRSLTDLSGARPEVPESGTPVPPRPEVPRPASTGIDGGTRLRAARAVSNSRSPEVPTSEVGTSEVVTPGQAKYLQLERKETLLWPRQVNELTILRRVLNRRRGRGQGERITENTLIRVAVDYLIANAGDLRGVTEDELRQSLGISVSG